MLQFDDTDIYYVCNDIPHSVLVSAAFSESDTTLNEEILIELCPNFCISRNI